MLGGEEPEAPVAEEKQQEAELTRPVSAGRARRETERSVLNRASLLTLPPARLREHHQRMEERGSHWGAVL